MEERRGGKDEGKWRRESERRRVAREERESRKGSIQQQLDMQPRANGMAYATGPPKCITVSGTEGKMAIQTQTVACECRPHT